MANSIDFRADQIQTKQIIVTGSGAGTTKLLIYGIEAQGSPVNEGEIDTNVFTQDGIGGDVFLFVSGAVNTKDSATVRGTSVFGGDLVVSGSLYNGSPAPAPAIRGIYSHAEGNSTTAEGAYSHAEGESTTAFGEYSHAEGRDTRTNGKWSHAEGRDSIASANYTHAEGYGTLASTLYSHAEGYLTTGSGQASHAEGYQTNTLGQASHAEGYQTQTTGAYSHAQGSGSITWGIYSFAAGNRTIASGSVDVIQAAFGRFNKRNNTTSLFVVGNGTGDSDALRGDIFRTESTGQLVLSGGIRHHLSRSIDPVDDILTKQNYIYIKKVISNQFVTLPVITSDEDIGLTVTIVFQTAGVFTLTITGGSGESITGFGVSTLNLVLNGNSGGRDLTGRPRMSVTLTYIGYDAGVPAYCWQVIHASDC